MKTLRNIAFALLVLALSSCGITKEVWLPKEAVPANFRGVLNADTNSVGLMPVKDFFDNGILQRLIDTALAKNLDLQIALKNIDAADLILKRAKAANLPNVAVGVNASSTRPSDNSLNGLSTSQFLKTSHIEDYNANVNLSWEADIWGKIRNQKAVANAEYLKSAETKKAVQTRIVAQVSTAFYRLLMLDAQLTVARKNLALSENTLKMINLQFNAGQVSSLAVQQSDAQRLRAAQLIPQISQEITVNENALSILAGNFPSAIERVTTLDQLPVPEQLSVGIPATMLSIRPDVKRLELELRIANAKVGIANASLYPSLVISASGGLNSFQASNWFNIPASLFGMAAGSITQPLLQRKTLKTQFELAKIERDQSVLLFRQGILDAVGEVSNEQARMVNLKNEYQIAENRVNTLQLAVKNSDLLFRGGMANYLEVITAQSNLLQGELDLATLKTARLNASVSLYRALGGGWK